MDSKLKNLNEKEEYNLIIRKKVMEILQAVGCEKEIFEKIKDYKSIDIEELLNKLKILLEFKYTKLQLVKILTENIEFLYVSIDTIRTNIEFIEQFFDDIGAAKESIYNYPQLLTLDDNKYRVLEVLNKFEIPEKVQKCMLLENPAIFGMQLSILNRQLTYLKKQSKDYNKFISKLMHFPTMLGTNLLEEINISNE